MESGSLFPSTMLVLLKGIFVWVIYGLGNTLAGTVGLLLLADIGNTLSFYSGK